VPGKSGCLTTFLNTDQVKMRAFSVRYYDLISQVHVSHCCFNFFVAKQSFQLVNVHASGSVVFVDAIICCEVMPQFVC